MMFMCDHCAREVETDLKEPYTCHGPIDREAWAKLPIKRPHPKLVTKNSDGVEMCIGTMRPIEDFAPSRFT